MKLEDIKPPKGFKIRGYETPKTGDYILCPDNTFDIAGTAGLGYQSFCIVLDKVWEPEIGKYYEFADYADFPTPIIRKYIGNPRENEKYKYEDETGETWRYIRPFKEELLGK